MDTRKILITSSVASILVAVFVYALAPLLTISGIKTAAAKKDSAMLDEYVDFPALRRNVKDQLMTVAMGTYGDVGDNPLAGTIITTYANTIVGAAVDGYVTPSALFRLIEADRSGKTVDTSPFINDADYSLDSLNSYTITTYIRDADPVRFVLKRYGFSWKLANIIIPM